MARTIEEIQQTIFDRIAADENLAGLSSASKVAIWRLFVFVVAFACWTLEVLFDTHKAEVDKAIREQKSGGLTWYKTMALRFQYGFTLLTESYYFDNGMATDEQIEASKIVKYAAVSEPLGNVILKIAGEANGVLSPISAEQLTAFIPYIERVKIAGVTVVVINYLPDRLWLNIQIKRDALVLDENGMNIFSAKYPVVDALNEFMKELPFDGELRLSALVDKLQKVPGVLDATLLSAESAWIDEDTADYADPQPITISAVPVSGYFEIATFDNINYNGL